MIRFDRMSGGPDTRRRATLRGLAASLLTMGLPTLARAQQHSDGGSGGHQGGAGGQGHAGGGGESGGGGAGRTPAQRAIRHRERTRHILGGGGSGGGHTGGGDHGGHTGDGGSSTTDPPVPSPGSDFPTDGSTTGPIGGAAGGEHFVHEGPGYWGADGKVLRRR